MMYLNIACRHSEAYNLDKSQKKIFLIGPNQRVKNKVHKIKLEELRGYKGLPATSHNFDLLPLSRHSVITINYIYYIVSNVAEFNTINHFLFLL